MMVKFWILMVFMSAGADGGRAISQPITFNTEAMCEAAAKKIADETGRSNYTRWGPVPVCIENMR
jgi:hypothetical protein